MRLRRFLIQKEEITQKRLKLQSSVVKFSSSSDTPVSRADFLANKIPQDLMKAIRNLSSAKIKKMFKTFMPLDLAALIQKENSTAFEEVLREMILQKSSSSQIKDWTAELGIEKEDVASETYVKMLRNDPKQRGALTQILQDGSDSSSFHYAPKADEDLRVALKQSMAPLSNSNLIAVPFCPIDKSLGIEKPLWEVDVEGGDLKITQGLDKGRCTQKELVKRATQEEFNRTKETNEGLTSDQIEEISSGKRSLEYEDGNIILRCTFKHFLPTLQKFLEIQVQGALSSILTTHRQSLGRNIPPEKYRRHKELIEKSRKNELNYTEKAELSSLEDYFKKKNINFVHNPTSLDTPVGGSSEGEGKSLHETLTMSEDSDQESSKAAEFELSRSIGERELSVLIQVVEVVPMQTLKGLYDKFESIMRLSSKDSLRPSLDSQIVADLDKISQKFFSKAPTSHCTVCNFESKTPVDHCPRALEMRKTVVESYAQALDQQEFNKAMQKLGEEATNHYNQSGIVAKIDKAYSTVEVSEDDTDLDFSEISSEATKESKVDLNKFKEMIESFNSKNQEAAYYGKTIVTSDPSVVDEDDIQKIETLTTYLKKIINDIFMQELEEEFLALIKTHGEM